MSKLELIITVLCSLSIIIQISVIFAVQYYVHVYYRREIEKRNEMLRQLFIENRELTKRLEELNDRK